MEKYRVELKERDLIITLDNQDTRNALSSALIRKVNATITELLRNNKEVRSIIYTNNGPIFSSGADLNELQAFGEDKTAVRNMFEDFNFLLTFNYTGEIPTIAYLKGGAIGGGVGLAMSCQYMAVEENCFFKLPELDIGLFPYIISGVLLRRLGIEEFIDLVCFSKRYDYNKIVERKLADFYIKKNESVFDYIDKVVAKKNTIKQLPLTTEDLEKLKISMKKRNIQDEVIRMVIKAIRINSEMLLPVANMAASNELSDLIQFLKRQHK